jgi:hypothetical protein
VRAIEGNYALKLLKTKYIVSGSTDTNTALRRDLFVLLRAFLLVWGFVFIRHRGESYDRSPVVRTTGKILEITENCASGPGRDDGVKSLE